MGSAHVQRQRDVRADGQWRSDRVTRLEQKEAVVKGWVYFARHGAEGPIKIGRAYDPHTRVRDLAVGSPIGLVLLGAVLSTSPEKEEVEIHARLHEHCIRGEWFAAEAVLHEMRRLRNRMVLPEKLKRQESPNAGLNRQVHSPTVAKKDVTVRMRADVSEVKRWRAAARRAKRTLSDWMRLTLLNAAGPQG